VIYLTSIRKHRVRGYGVAHDILVTDGRLGFDVGDTIGLDGVIVKVVVLETARNMMNGRICQASARVVTPAQLLPRGGFM
jgi:hypothetical protein